VSSLQKALSHCAAISGFFWPIAKDKLAAARGKTLREVFHMADDSPLRSSAIRNYAEHFDERLDRFLSGDPMGQLRDFVIGPSDLADEEATHVMLLVDPEAQIVVLFGERFHFSGLTEFVHAVHTAAAQMDKHDARLTLQLLF
jgi:hypothetical protein